MSTTWLDALRGDLGVPKEQGIVAIFSSTKILGIFFSLCILSLLFARVEPNIAK